MGMERDTETIGPVTLTDIQQRKYQAESDLKSSIVHLSKSEDVIERQTIEINKCREDLREIEDRMKETDDAEERKNLNTDKKKIRTREEKIREAMGKEKEILLQAKVTISALKKKIYDLEEQATNILDKEIDDTAELRRRARDERKRRDNELKTLRQTPSEERGAVGGAVKRNSKRPSGTQHKQDKDAAYPSLLDEFCSMILEKLYPGQKKE